MIVPDLTVDKQLHKSHTALHQSPGNQTASTIRIRRLSTDPVELQCRCGFLLQIQRIRGRSLHPRRQFPRLYSRLQTGLPSPLLLMPQVQPPNQLTLNLRHIRRLLKVRTDIQHRCPRGTKTSPLEGGRQKPGSPVVDAVHRQPLRILQHDITRQIPILTAQPPRDPRPQRRPPRKLAATVIFVQRRFMSQIRGVHSTQQRQIIHMPRQLRHQFTHPHSALTILSKSKGAAQQGPRRIRKLHLARYPVKVLLTVPASQFGLRIKQIHLTGTTIHKQMYYGRRRRTLHCPIRTPRCPALLPLSRTISTHLAVQQ